MMSITYCLLLCLLSLSLQACKARSFSASVNNDLQKKLHVSNQIQNGEKKVSIREKVMECSSSSIEQGVGKEASIMEGTDHHQKGDSIKKLNNSSTAKQKLMAEENVARKSSIAFQKECLVSASWRVPHKKRGEKHPGFNLDYSPPKTHPPSHN